MLIDDRFKGPWLPFILQLLPFAAIAGQSRFLPYAFAFAATVNLGAWLVALGKKHNILDTPTSRIASAAQGYVELMGRGCAPAEGELLTPHSRLPCLWYRTRTLRRRGGQWEQVDSGESTASFVLDDSSGLCEIDPEGAEVLTTHSETRTVGDLRHIEEILLAGDRLYVIGQLTSRSGADLTLDRRQDLGDLLSEWKQDQAALHQRFDLDGNGEIDPREWQLAQRAAAREIEREHETRRQQPRRHLLGKPGGRALYLISNRDPESLGRRYAAFAWLHLALLLGSLYGVGWAWDRGPI